MYKEGTGSNSHNQFSSLYPSPLFSFLLPPLLSLISSSHLSPLLHSLSPPPPLSLISSHIPFSSLLPSLHLSHLPCHLTSPLIFPLLISPTYPTYSPLFSSLPPLLISPRVHCTSPLSLFLSLPPPLLISLTFPHLSYLNSLSLLSIPPPFSPLPPLPISPSSYLPPHLPPLFLNSLTTPLPLSLPPFTFLQPPLYLLSLILASLPSFFPSFSTPPSLPIFFASSAISHSL